MNIILRYLYGPERMKIYELKRKTFRDLLLLSNIVVGLMLFVFIYLGLIKGYIRAWVVFPGLIINILSNMLVRYFKNNITY